MKKEIAKLIESQQGVYVDHKTERYSFVTGGACFDVPKDWIEKAESISNGKIASITIRFPKKLQRRLNHLKADDKIESIQSITIKAVSDAVERMEKDG